MSITDVSSWNGTGNSMAARLSSPPSPSLAAIVSEPIYEVKQVELGVTTFFLKDTTRLTEAFMLRRMGICLLGIGRKGIEAVRRKATVTLNVGDGYGIDIRVPLFLFKKCDNANQNIMTYETRGYEGKPIWLKQNFPYHLDFDLPQSALFDMGHLVNGEVCAFLEGDKEKPI